MHHLVRSRLTTTVSYATGSDTFTTRSPALFAALTV